MSDLSKFWVAINIVFFSALTAVIFISTAYWKDHNRKIVEMIGRGVDPVAAMCALQDDYGKMPTCIILATKSSQPKQI